MTPVLILLVEDDPVARFVTEKQLAKAGYRFESVTNGEEALQRYKNEFSLVIMDVGLPGIDGLAATRHIRDKERAEGWTPVPIIALTAHSNKQECLAAGMDDYLQKPVLLDDLRQILDRWLQTL